MPNLCSAIRATLGQRQFRQSPGLALNAHSGNEWGKIPVLTGIGLIRFKRHNFLYLPNILNQKIPPQKFCLNSVTENNPISAALYTFISRTSTYTITFAHHYEGRLRPGLGLVYSLERHLKNYFSAAEVVFLVFLAEYSAAKAPRFSFWP